MAGVTTDVSEWAARRNRWPPPDPASDAPLVVRYGGVEVALSGRVEELVRYLLRYGEVLRLDDPAFATGSLTFDWGPDGRGGYRLKAAPRPGALPITRSVAPGVAAEAAA